MKKTKNYEIFKLLGANRKTSKGHVKRIANSILENNLLKHNPIIVDNNMVVIDGQHRLEAAKQLGVEIYYTDGGFIGAKQVRNLNSSQRQWTMADFVRSFAETSDDYQYLYDFSQANDLPLSVAARILTNFTGNSSSKAVRMGDFRIGDMEQVEAHMEAVKRLEPFISNVARKDRQYNATITVLRNNKIDWDKMETKARAIAASKDSREIITKQSNKRSYLRLFEDIYNYHTKTQVRFYG